MHIYILEPSQFVFSGKASATKSAESSNGFGGSYHFGDTIRFDNVTCYTPTGKRLVHDILLLFMLLDMHFI